MPNKPEGMEPEIPPRLQTRLDRLDADAQRQREIVHNLTCPRRFGGECDDPFTQAQGAMTEPPMIPPALTAEEWAIRMVAWDAGNSFPVKQSVWLDDMGGAGVDSGAAFGTTDISQHRAPVAALCLHGQPFGFTQEDVQVLRKALDKYDRGRDEDGGWIDSYFSAEEGDRLTSLAARIAALLPPTP